MDTIANILSNTQKYITEIFLDTAMVTGIFVIAFIILFFLLNIFGVWNVTKKGPRWFKVLLFIVLFFISTLIGIITGFQVGLTKAGDKFVKESGKYLVTRGIKDFASSINIDLNTSINANYANKVLDDFHKYKILSSNDMSGKFINEVFDEIKGPFIKNSKQFIVSNSNQSEFNLLTISDNVWGDVSSDISSQTKTVVTAHYMHGVGIITPILIVFLICTILLKFVIRFMQSEAAKTKK